MATMWCRARKSTGAPRAQLMGISFLLHVHAVGDTESQEHPLFVTYPEGSRRWAGDDREGTHLIEVWVGSIIVGGLNDEDLVDAIRAGRVRLCGGSIQWW